MIDVHAHLRPLGYLEFLAQAGIKPPVVPPWRPDAPAPRPIEPWSNSEADCKLRMEEMAKAGVRRQILSPTFAPYLEDADLAGRAARCVNDEIAATVARHPEAFGAFGSLPLPHIELAKAEIGHALDHLGMDGITIQCFCGDKSIADPLFEPIFEELDRRAAVLFFHPTMNGLCSHQILGWRLEAAAGPVFEDAMVVLQMMVAAIPSRYPRIRMIIPHLGGALPAMLARLDNQLPAAHNLAELPSRSARRLWYDTCCHGSAPALRMAVEALGSDRLLIGSDFPFLTTLEPYAATVNFVKTCGLSEEQVRQIMHTNAEVLFEQGAAQDTK